MCMLMCIHMLTKRTNILLEEDLWKQLEALARAQKMSVSQFIREAIEMKLEENKRLKQTRKAIEEIRKIRPKPFKGKIDYEALINYGREY